MDGAERRRRWSEGDQRRILAAAFVPGATVAAVARQYDVATGLILSGAAPKLSWFPMSLSPLRCRRRHQS
ncbi:MULTISPECIES: transposase [unclassified Mesorhizobium]|uniref:transposase n=1 Tax=unclassified Mesorhizobium TaxID=325217 RepID=UPI0032AF6C7A